jgi:predicted phosphoribosyltransferase
MTGRWPAFRDRVDAGRALAAQLVEAYRGEEALVLGLPRGGVPVAFEVACALDAPLDVFLVRKLGAPGHEELAMGAIASGGVRVLNEDVVEALGVPPAVVDAIAARELAELRRRERMYRGERPYPSVAGRTVFLVDDGLATGATMRAAVAGVRLLEPAALVVAVPVAPPDTIAELRGQVDDVVALLAPERLMSVGQWYADFSQTTDDEVRELLGRAARLQAGRAGP